MIRRDGQAPAPTRGVDAVTRPPRGRRRSFKQAAQSSSLAGRPGHRDPLARPTLERAVRSTHSSPRTANHTAANSSAPGSARGPGAARRATRSSAAVDQAEDRSETHRPHASPCTSPQVADRQEEAVVYWMNATKPRRSALGTIRSLPYQIRSASASSPAPPRRVQRGLPDG